MWKASTYFGNFIPQVGGTYNCTYCKQPIASVDFHENKAIRLDHIKLLSIYKFAHKQCINSTPSTSISSTSSTLSTSSANSGDSTFSSTPAISLNQTSKEENINIK